MKEQIKLWTNRIARIVADYKRLAAACDAAEKAGAMHPEGPLHEAIWKSHSLLLAQCDFAGWVSWFIFDNECGKKKLAASVRKGSMTIIRTPAQLAKLLVKIQSTQ